MNSTDIVAMLGNLAESLLNVQRLLSGLAYLIGIAFFIVAILKLRKIAGSSPNSPSQERMMVPLAYLLGGAAAVFLPSALTVLSNSLFGGNSIIQYGSYTKLNVMDSMGVVIKTVGLLWFIRGCVALVRSSEPGVQEGPKGLAYLLGGILAMNFNNTMDSLVWIMDKIAKYSLTLRTK